MQFPILIMLETAPLSGSLISAGFILMVGFLVTALVVWRVQGRSRRKRSLVIGLVFSTLVATFVAFGLDFKTSVIVDRDEVTITYHRRGDTVIECSDITEISQKGLRAQTVVQITTRQGRTYQISGSTEQRERTMKAIRDACPLLPSLLL